MYSVFLVMEHKSDGSAVVVEVHEDEEYARYKARRQRSLDDLFYFVVKRDLIGIPD